MTPADHKATVSHARMIRYSKAHTLSEKRDAACYLDLTELAGNLLELLAVGAEYAIGDDRAFMVEAFKHAKELLG